MNLRGKNFVGQIFHISVIKSTIAGLLDGDIYYFYVNVKGVNKVFYIDVKLSEDGKEIFRLYRDFTKFTHGENYMAHNDELIKVITSSQLPILNEQVPQGADNEFVDSKLVTYSLEPATDMSDYITVYIDAMQTV